MIHVVYGFDVKPQNNMIWTFIFMSFNSSDSQKVEEVGLRFMLLLRFNLKIEGGKIWIENARVYMIFFRTSSKVSMTSLLTHTVAHSTRPSFRLKTNNQPLKKFLSFSVSWVKVVKNGKILTFKGNFLCHKLSGSF